MSSLGNRAQVTIFLPCGNWALCSQMSVSVSVRVFSSFPQDKVRADQFSFVAATLAPCHCRPPGPGWLGWSRRPQKTGTFYSFFMDLTLVRLPRCSGPPLPVTQPRPRPWHALTQVSRCHQMSTHYIGWFLSGNKSSWHAASKNIPKLVPSTHHIFASFLLLSRRTDPWQI